MSRVMPILGSVEEVRAQKLDGLQTLIEGYHKTIKESNVLLDTMARNHEDETEDFQNLLHFNENMSKAYRKLEEAIKFLK